MYVDSVAKTLYQVSCVSREGFTAGEKPYSAPAVVAVAESFWQRYDCLPNCGGCCLGFSLDWLPSELEAADPEVAALAQERPVYVNGVGRMVHTIWPDQNRRYCQMLADDGSCSIHPSRPYSCRIELLKLRRSGDTGTIYVGPYNRAHMMKRATDGGQVRCEFGEFDLSRLCSDYLPALARLERWSAYFGIKTWLPLMMESVQSVALLGRPLRLEFYAD